MKIEKNIPIPLPRTGAANGNASLARTMEVGDSVRCPTKKDAFSVRRAIYNCKGYKPVIRKQPDGALGWRVWKVKKEDKGDDS